MTSERDKFWQAETMGGPEPDEARTDIMGGSQPNRVDTDVMRGQAQAGQETAAARHGRPSS